jgi:hypothetical protein
MDRFSQNMTIGFTPAIACASFCGSRTYEVLIALLTWPV